jgi:hypothetical protein
VLTSRKRIIAAAAAVVTLLGVALALAVSGPATAANKPASGPAGPAVTWFQLKSADLKDICVVEKGATDAVYGAVCSANHSDYWKWTSAGELLNEHSGKCLSVTGTSPGLYANTCTNNHAQLWNDQLVPVIAGGTLYSFTEYVNDHAHLSLGLIASATGTAVDQVASGDTLWPAQ